MPIKETPTAECYAPFLNAIAHPACVLGDSAPEDARNDAWKSLSKDEQKRILHQAKEVGVGKHRFDEGHLQVEELSIGGTFVQYIKDESEYLLYSHAIKSVSHEALVIISDHSIVNCNERFVHMFGFHDREDVLQRKITDFISEPNLDRLRLSVSVDTQRVEMRARKNQNTLMYLEVTAADSRIQEEEVTILAISDISDKKRAEQAMFQSKELYRSLIENSPTGIFILREKRFQYANMSGIQLLGAKNEDEIYNTTFLDFVVPDSQSYVNDLLEAARNGEEIDFIEIGIVNLKGKPLKAELRATLTVYDAKPSLQVSLTNLTLREELMQEKIKAQLAEEINAILKTEIEEHKSTQQRLRSARNFTRRIIDSSIDMIMAVDTKGAFTEFNKAAQRQFGVAKNKALQVNLSSLFKKAEDRAFIQAKLKSQGTYVGEIEALKTDGTAFTCFLSASILKDDEGKIVGSMAIARDITLIKKAETRLIKSEERYRDIFENATDFIFSVGANGKLRYVNDALIKALGYPVKELKSMDFKELVLFPETKGDEFFKALAGSSVEITLKGKNEEQIIAEGNSSIKYNSENKATAIRSIMRDVTAQRKSLRYAMEQKAKLESILNSTENIMMCTLDRKKNITSFNTNFAETMIRKFDVAFTFGDNYINLLEGIINPDLYQSQLKVFEDAFDGQAKQFELPVLNDQKENAWLMHFLNPIKVEEDSDEYDEISILCYDITDRKEIDRKIRDSLREKEVLLQEVHHRVKNNLQVISSILNLQSGYVKDEKTLEILEESQNRIKSMSFIHETLYQTNDFGQIEFGDYIMTLARNLVHSYSTNTGNIELKTDFDKVRLSLNQSIPCGLIVNELVSNTLKYAFPENRDGSVLISIKEVRNEIHLSVSDNGIGLPEEFKYEESDSLGVQLVYALSEQLDATIDLNTSEGTAFMFRFIKQ